MQSRDSDLHVCSHLHTGFFSASSVAAATGIIHATGRLAFGAGLKCTGYPNDFARSHSGSPRRNDRDPGVGAVSAPFPREPVDRVVVQVQQLGEGGDIAALRLSYEARDVVLVHSTFFVWPLEP